MHATDTHLNWLMALTQVPTAAGREGRVIEFLRNWTDLHPSLVMTADPVGNLVISRRAPIDSGRPPIYITAHMDHPAFVVERIVAPGTIEAAFRGGVMDLYFTDARVVAHDRNNNRRTGTVRERTSPEGAMFPVWLIELDDHTDNADTVEPGDVVTWHFPEAQVDEHNILHTNACDDLAAAAAALGAMSVLTAKADEPSGEQFEDVRLLFTRAEEIGFIGAIGACEHETMPKSSRVVALENSRAFPDSPIGGGPILRIGDRMSVFSPPLSDAIGRRAETITGHSAHPRATERTDGKYEHPWQRKLMPGGACEASVFCAYGYEATCICLPLGNYHNMANLTEVQEGKFDEQHPPRVGREYISVDDFRGMVDLLIAVGTELPERSPVRERVEKLYADRAFVLDEKA